MSKSCGLGEIRIIDGGTKQSKRFYEVRREAKENECYAKLKYPSNTYITRIGELAFLTIPHIQVYKKPDGVLAWEDPCLGYKTLLIDGSLLTPENIMKICSANPHAMMGGVIEDYQNETVPMLLHQLSLVFPKNYKEFCAAYPGYKVRKPNWVGRYAKLSTCNRSERYTDCHGNEFYFDGDYIVCDHYHLSFTPFGSKDTVLPEICLDGIWSFLMGKEGFHKSEWPENSIRLKIEN